MDVVHTKRVGVDRVEGRCGQVAGPHSLVRADAPKHPLAPNEKLCLSCCGPDVRLLNAGSMIQFFLYTPAAREWVEENVDAPDYMWLGESNFCCEHRYAADIANGMEEAGLEVVS